MPTRYKLRLRQRADPQQVAQPEDRTRPLRPPEWLANLDRPDNLSIESASKNQSKSRAVYLQHPVVTPPAVVPVRIRTRSHALSVSDGRGFCTIPAVVVTTIHTTS